MKKASNYILSILLITTMQLNAQVAKYVAPNGVDNNASGAITNPFKTIGYGAARINPGDTLFVRGGTYVNADFDPTNIWVPTSTARINNVNGTAAQYKYIKAYPGEVPIINGDGPIVFNVRNSTYLHIEGFTIIGEFNNIPWDSAKKYQFIYIDENLDTLWRVAPGTPDATVDMMPFPIINDSIRPSRFTTQGMVLNNCHHVTVKNCNISDMPGAGLRLQGCDYINILNNKVSNCTRRSSIGNPGLVLSFLNSIDNNSGTKIIIEGNEVYNNYNEIYSWNGDKTFINTTIDEGKGMNVEHVIARPSGLSWDFGRILFRNNIAYNNGFSGLNTNDAERVDFVNNTVFNNFKTGHGQNTGISVNKSDDVTIKNNIAVSLNTFSGYAISKDNVSTNVVVDNNLVWGLADPAIASIATNLSYGDPFFLDTANRNFNLLANSAAINASVAGSNVPSTDYYQLPRSGVADLGAVEYNPTLPVTLVFFKAVLEGNKVNLQWRTTLEQQLARFEVEKKIGTNWVVIATILPRGAGVNYQLYDNDVSNGMQLYRLKKIDLDQSYAYSTIASVRIAGVVAIAAYPNPCTDFITVKNVSAKEPLDVVNSAGVSVLTFINRRFVDGQWVLTVAALPKGSYYITANQQVIKFIKN